MRTFEIGKEYALGRNNGTTNHAFYFGYSEDKHHFHKESDGKTIHYILNMTSLRRQNLREEGKIEELLETAELSKPIEEKLQQSILKDIIRYRKIK